MTDRELDDFFRRLLLDAVGQEYGKVMDELPEHVFSPAFEKKMQKLIHRANHPIRYRVAQAAACLLLVALLSGCTALAISPEARAAFSGWVREVYEAWFVYRYTGEERPSLEDTVYLPTWVPGGYKEIVSPQVGTFVRTQYENDEKDLLTVSYIKGTETSSLNVEWEGATVRQTSVGSLPADLYHNPGDGPNVLVWTDMEKDAAFWITAPLSEEELVQVAESIQESAPMPKRYRITWLPMDYGGGYSLASVNEELGKGEFVYVSGGEQDFSIIFGYSDGAALAPHPETENSVVYVWGSEARLYPALEDGGDKTLVWTAEDGTILWVCSPLPDDEMIQIAESVIVHPIQFTDLIEIQTDGSEAPLLEAVERALTEDYVAQVEDCARRASQTGNYASKEYERLWKGQQAKYVSPERDEAVARVSALADVLRQEGRTGETIVSLFGPFYTASIRVSKFDDSAYELLPEEFIEHYFDTYAHIVDERGVLIASYQVKHLSGKGEIIIVPTAEEMQFSYISNQIYMKTFQAAQAELSGQE